METLYYDEPYKRWWLICERGSDESTIDRFVVAAYGDTEETAAAAVELLIEDYNNKVCENYVSMIRDKDHMHFVFPRVQNLGNVFIMFLIDHAAPIRYDNMN